MMKHLLIALAIIITLLKPFKGISQFSSLFLTPSYDLDLPIFNPAYAGDNERFRLYSIAANYNNSSNFGDSQNHIFGFDSRKPLRNTNTEFSYGIAWTRNSVNQRINEQGMDLSVNDGMKLIYNYGVAEIFLGMRIPIASNSTSMKKAGMSEDKNVSKMNSETRAFIHPINHSWVCDRHSLLSFIAFNFNINYNYNRLRNENGLLLGDQFVFNDVNSGSQPFSIRESQDPVSIGQIDGTAGIDFGFGMLVHYAINNYESIRASYSQKHLIRGYSSIGESDQTLWPLAIAQIDYTRSLFNKEIRIGLMNIYQSMDNFYGKTKINQYRLDLSLPIRFINYQRNVKKGKTNLTSFIPALSTFSTNQIDKFQISMFSLLLGLEFRSNPNFRKKNKRNSLYQGIDYLAFISIDAPIGGYVPLKDSYGNFRLGLIFKGWQ